MEQLKNSERKVNKTAFGILGGFVVLLIGIFLVSRFTNKAPEPVKQLVVMEPVSLPNATPQNDVHSPNWVLQQRLTDLQRLQLNYNHLVTAGKDNKGLENLRTSIMLAEEAFRSSIDSIWISAIADKNTDSLQLKTIAAYRSSLDSIRTINGSLNMATASSDFVPDREAFIKLQNELVEKTNKIALLESSIEMMSKQAPADENIIDSKPPKQNLGLAENTHLLESKIAELTTGNQRLQQEMERLRKQPVEIPKSSNNEQLLLNRNTALQQKVTAINAELQLVRVDCNLSRADATQIISNSKQRKQLLSEASNILIDLSTSSDADIRSKVKEKIVRLNQVAANTRD